MGSCMSKSKISADEQRRRDAMLPINVTVRQANGDFTKITVKPWQNVHQSVFEGLKPGLTGLWALHEVRYGGEPIESSATWESEGV